MSEYTRDAENEIPLAGYAMIMGAFTLAFTPLLVRAAARGALPRNVETRDLVLMGVATHKLTRILTRDWVTSPLRAPFTQYVKSEGAGEVQEKSRGHGLRRAVGDLLTCPFCTGPWVASALTALFVARPRVARTIAGVLGVVAISDFAHQLYAGARKLSG
ncbi:MAG TPA: DUF1360 domain-containing protein [Labilithrix sp.]|jgi:hypothetical protein